jgi:hypothetical protein
MYSLRSESNDWNAKFKNFHLGRTSKLPNNSFSAFVSCKEIVGKSAGEWRRRMAIR